MAAFFAVVITVLLYFVSGQHYFEKSADGRYYLLPQKIIQEADLLCSPHHGVEYVETTDSQEYLTMCKDHSKIEFFSN